MSDFKNSLSLNGTSVSVVGHTHVILDTTGLQTALDDLDSEKQQIVRLSIAVPVVVGGYIEIGNFNISHGAHSFFVSVTVSSKGFSTAKNYSFNVKYGDTSGVFQLLKPLTTGGAYSGQDLELEIAVTTSIAYLRIKRTVGTTAGTAIVTILPTGLSNDVFTASSATGTSTSSIYYAGSISNYDYTAADVLTKIKTVDGVSSGLDADLLDGNHSSAFSLDGHTHSYLPLTGGTLTGDITTYRIAAPTTGVIYLGNTGNKYLYFNGVEYNLPGANLYVNSVQAVTNSGTWSISVTGSSASCTGNAATATSAGNADTLDSQHGSYYTTAANINNTPAGNIAATNLQAAINELDTEKEPALGNPGTSGFVLSSDTSGTRSWVAKSSAILSSSSLFFLAGW